MTDSAAAPSQAEFHAVIARGADRWYAACLRITRNREWAEDAVQDALLNAWNRRHQYQRSAQLDTWIYRIAVNAALAVLRKNRPARWESLDREVPDESVMPENASIAEEFDSELTAAMKNLSEVERVCFVLKHIEQWRLKEIAAELDTSVDTIKQAVFRAVMKLRVTLADRRRA
jgi:RNA polymerase sigma-70 factor (ECF subfamily)